MTTELRPDLDTNLPRTFPELFPWKFSKIMLHNLLKINFTWVKCDPEIGHLHRKMTTKSGPNLDTNLTRIWQGKIPNFFPNFSRTWNRPESWIVLNHESDIPAQIIPEPWIVPIIMLHHSWFGIDISERNINLKQITYKACSFNLTYKTTDHIQGMLV